MTDILTVGIASICSTPGVVVPRRLQVSHDHNSGSHDYNSGSHDYNSGSHVTPVSQYKDIKVATAPKSYQYTEPAESSRSVSMDTEDTGHDEMSYDGQYVVIRVC